MKKGLKRAKNTPNVLLIGAGRFGKAHLKTLKELEGHGHLRVLGVVVKNKNKHKKTAKEFDVEFFSELSVGLLKKSDAAFVVTPQETHFELVKKCLKYTNVLVEKPMANTEKEAQELVKLSKKSKHTLSVGHLYRFYPVTLALKRILGKKAMPRKIIGEFINPVEADQGREPAMEFLHLFDVVDYIWEKEPEAVTGRAEGSMTIADIRYKKFSDARFFVGCKGNSRKRVLTFKYNDLIIEADFMASTIKATRGTEEKITDYPIIEPLKAEILHFLEIISGEKNDLDAKMGARLVSLTRRAIPKKKELPRIAVIGGGIFGTSIASELAAFSNVTLFEKNGSLLMEGSFVNQYRHHKGYHYPRSDETVQEIQKTTEEFERVYKKAIIEGWKTYYGLAKKGSFVNKKEFIAFCKRNNLPYKISFPHKDLLKRELMDLSIEVPEPNYGFKKLLEITENRLKIHKNIKVLKSTLVTNCALLSSGEKEIMYDSGNGEKKAKFDYVINATYARINQFARWLDHEARPVRVDLAEVLIVNLPIEPVSITVVDGPFATLMPTGNPHEFTLYHVTESILDRYVPEDGLVKKIKKARSNKEKIFAESLKLFPILKDAKIVESRIVFRGVRAYREHDDSRVADLVDHGFGTWSVLSGKILSSVSMGKAIAKIIKDDLRGTTHSS
jgi:predicted dehydrogenase